MDTLLKVAIHKKCVCSIHILTSNTSIMSYYDLFELGSNVLEQYVSSEASLLKNKYDWQVYVLPKTVVSDSIYKKKIIELITKLQSNRYQTYKEYIFFNHGFGKRLCYEDVFLSDHDIDLANGYSKWRYPSNNVLFINSNLVQLFATASIIHQEPTKKNEPVRLLTNCKIMSLANSSIQQKNNIDYLQWEHGCKVLGKRLVSITNEHKYIFVNNCYNQHWQFLFGYLDHDKLTNQTKIQVYICDSLNVVSRENINNDSSTLNKNQLRLLTLVRLMKLFLFISKFKNQGDKSIIINTNDNAVLINKELQEEVTSINNDEVTFLNVSQQHDMYSCGVHIINHFHSILRLIHNNTSLGKSCINANKFDKDITDLKSFKYFPTEYLQIRSDLLEFWINFKYVTSILHYDHASVCFNNIEDDAVRSKIHDLMSSYNKSTVTDNMSTNKANIELAETIDKAIIQFIDQIKNQTSLSKCQCCAKFPRKQLHLLKRNNEHENWPDIHQFSDNLVKELYWKCRRFKRRTEKGAFYYKTIPSESNYKFGKKSIKSLMKILRPTNEGYIHDDIDYSDEILDTFFARLSFKCMFKAADIPDGGSCCEWIPTALIMSKDMKGEYFSYLNDLRKAMKFETFSFGNKPQEINKDIRMLYAFSLTYGYQPSIEDFMNTDYSDELNHSYCRSVFGYMYNLCKLHKDQSNVTFLQCCRNFISLTPSQVGKYGCMWGQSDFLLWFQCVFNIRLFMINKQTFGNSISITSEFENSYFFGNSEVNVSQVDDENQENNGIFDFNDKSKLMPFGIMIGFIDGSHFDKLFIPYDQTSPLIPVGSEAVTHVTPYLKISKELWSSLTIDNIKQHNKEVIDRKEIDKNKELNYWYDCHFAFEKVQKSEQPIFPPLAESRNENYEKYSVPQCGIKFEAIYIALLCYVVATKKRENP